MAQRDARGEMPFLDHLEELRWRILYSLLAIVVGTLVGWVVVEHVDIIGLLMRPVAPLLHDQKLVFTRPTEPFLITLKFGFALGCLLASPVVVYHIWAFLTPALYAKERRVIMPAFSVGIVLFLAGASVAYLWVLPRALKVLFGFQSAVLTPFITADAYFGFAAQICIAFGLITELPLLVIILAALTRGAPAGPARRSPSPPARRAGSACRPAPAAPSPQPTRFSTPCCGFRVSRSPATSPTRWWCAATARRCRCGGVPSSCATARDSKPTPFITSRTAAASTPAARRSCSTRPRCWWGKGCATTPASAAAR